MLTSKRILILSLFIFAATIAFLQQGLSVRQDSGSFIVEPSMYTAGQFGSWTATYTVGSEGIEEGGMVTIEFPHSWHIYPWLYKMRREATPDGKPAPPWRASKDKAEQIDRPADWHYVGGKVSRPGVRVSTMIKRNGLDNEIERFSRLFTITVEEGELIEGDKVVLEYKRTSAPPISEVNVINIAVDGDGDGQYELRPASAEVEILPSYERGAMIIAPSRVQAGTPVEFTVAALDQFSNSTEKFDGQFRFSASDPKAELPAPYDFQPVDKGRKTLTATFQTPGVHYITGHDNKHLASLGLLSNPIDVTAEKPAYNIYWGDLHSHCEISHDGNGRAVTAFEYARDVSRLDFYTLTDHTVHITDAEWEETQQLVRRYHDPGRFVTMLANEWSARAPYGHNNVIYYDDRAEIIRMPFVNQLPELWKRLEGKRVFTLPHKTAPGVTWNFKHPLRTSIEIYSMWGNSEFYGAENKYEDVDYFGNPGAGPGPHYARDAWEAGQRIGVLGGSDDHLAHPGQIFGGLSAVIAPELTRDALHTSVNKRHTYATTGHRMLLYFTINGHLMGDVISLGENEYPTIHVTASALDNIGKLEVMRWDGREWSAVYEYSAQSRHADISFTDTGYTRSSIYYVRVIQEREYKNVMEYRGRWVMAWSSPIWVEKS